MSKFMHRLFLLGVASLYVGILIFSFKYETNPYLWYDEAGQFWIAKGLNHYSSPNSPCGSVIDVIHNNRDYNLDPGGYGIILHFWSMISNHYMWLRTLSVLFFLFSSAIFVWLFHRWLSDWSIALIMGFIPFIIPMFYHEAFEIRAYSMEIMGTMLCVAAIVSLRESINIKKLLLWSCVFSAFLFSRYSISVVTFATACYILFQIFTKDCQVKEQIKMTLFFSIPMLLSLIAIYYLAMKYQNPELKSLSYLPYLNQKPRELLHDSSLIHFFYIGLILWTFIKVKDKKTKDKYRGLIFITITTNVLFVILSALGFHPWGADTTRCISMIVLVVVSFSAICGEVISLAYSKVPGIAYILLAFVSLRFLVLYKKDFKLSKQRDNSYTEFLSIRDRLDSNSHVYVDYWESPCMRYQFEFGLLHGDHLYPDNFTFGKYGKHGYNTTDDNPQFPFTQPNMKELNEYDILICPRLYWKCDFDLWRAVGDSYSVFVKKTKEL